ncbi:MAG: teichoic acid biosynthesis protein [Pirellula sp.]|nr:teichoic acid biosynthesis protein [Pirellula sp.]
MATIVYSMCGEGRGHATRVQTVVEMLVPQHRFILLAARDAYEYLYDRYQGNPMVSVRRLPGLFFAYRNQQVDYLRSVCAAAPYLVKLSGMVRYISRMIEREQPSLAITDFEPVLPRAAKRMGVPWISLDHQHFLSVSNFQSMPVSFRWRGWFLRASIPMFYSGQSGEAVSSFFHLPPRPGTESIPRIGVLLRSGILQAARLKRPSRGHILVYVRRHAPESLWQALKRSGRQCIVYGLGERPAQENIQFHAVSDHGFIQDLSTSDCLVTTAGNQLIGEAFYLNKPVLAIPEPGNFEQQLNAWLVAQSQGGWSTTFSQLTPHLLQQFLFALPTLRHALSSLQVSGNLAAKSFIESYLPAKEGAKQEPFDSTSLWGYSAPPALAS